MKRNRLLTGIILFLIIIIPASLFYSCVTARNVSPSEITREPGRKVICYFHCEDSLWNLYPVRGERGYFTGILVSPDNIPKNRLRGTHIYAGPRAVIKIENDRLTCPLENIDRVENYKVRAGTIISSIGVVLLLFLVPTFL